MTTTVNTPNSYALSVVRATGNNLATTATVSAGGITTGLTATLPASYLTTAGTVPITIYSPGPGGGTSTAVNFTVSATTPSLTSLSSPLIGANGAQTVTFNGANIPSGSTIKLRLGSQTYTISSGNTTWISTSQIQVSVTLGADPATWYASVVTPGGVSSSELAFQVSAPVPTISSLSPNSANAGSGSLTITVNTPNAHALSVVRANGNNLITIATVSAGGITTGLTATLPASYLTAAGTVPITI